ncbi:MAG: peptide chain release factor 3 [Deferribacterales bacterium]
MSTNIKNEISRRRTFAIISHPDAGKTTLTEKLLLYGGALDLAGSVTAKKKQRETSSDWMELEKKRGISISSTVLQFEYSGYQFNLLDTPGHKDFSEDTYRVLLAVDAAIMVIDAGKGIENQTLKLFEVCRKRGVPIFTFMNKLDRPAKSPLELIDQVEKELNIQTFPVNWPLESGPFFKGVYDRVKKQVHLFEKVPGGAYKAPVSVHDFSDESVKEKLSEKAYDEIAEELEMLEFAHNGLDMDEVLSGKTTPVFFGSAANNFGVELLLKGFLEYSGEPVPRNANGAPVPLDKPGFTGFVFKIQTNMNPKHRDRIVFIRACSGKFTRDMTAYNTRTGREVRLSNSQSVFGQEREIKEEAYAGDIIGFITNADLRIGDTLTTDPKIVYNEIPRFAPEVFAYMESSTVSNYKAFRKGIDHLLAEDLVQSFELAGSTSATPLLGAVGPLQFEVLQYRMKDEYGVDAVLVSKPWTVLRWVDPSVSVDELKKAVPYDCAYGKDDKDRLVILFPNGWTMRYFMEKNKEIVLHESPAAED